MAFAGGKTKPAPRPRGSTLASAVIEYPATERASSVFTGWDKLPMNLAVFGPFDRRLAPNLGDLADSIARQQMYASSELLDFRLAEQTPADSPEYHARFEELVDKADIPWLKAGRADAFGRVLLGPASFVDIVLPADGANNPDESSGQFSLFVSYTPMAASYKFVRWLNESRITLGALAASPEWAAYMRTVYAGACRLVVHILALMPGIANPVVRATLPRDVLVANAMPELVPDTVLTTTLSPVLRVLAETGLLGGLGPNGEPPFAIGPMVAKPAAWTIVNQIVPAEDIGTVEYYQNTAPITPGTPFVVSLDGKVTGIMEPLVGTEPIHAPPIRCPVNPAQVPFYPYYGMGSPDYSDESDDLAHARWAAEHLYPSLTSQGVDSAAMRMPIYVVVKDAAWFTALTRSGVVITGGIKTVTWTRFVRVERVSGIQTALIPASERTRVFFRTKAWAGLNVLPAGAPAVTIIHGELTPAQAASHRMLVPLASLSENPGAVGAWITSGERDGVQTHIRPAAKWSQDTTAPAPQAFIALRVSDRHALIKAMDDEDARIAAVAAAAARAQAEAQAAAE